MKKEKKGNIKTGKKGKREKEKEGKVDLGE